MKKALKPQDGAILLGAILLIWSIASLFVDPVKSQPRESPIDQLDYAAATVVLPHLETPRAKRNLASLSAGGVSVPITGTEAPFSGTPVPGQNPAEPSSGKPKGRRIPTAMFGQPGPTEDNAYLVPVMPTPTEAVDQPKLIPDRIAIPVIELDAQIMPSSYRLITVDGTQFQQWEAPNDFAAGWQTNSAPLGVPGNTVLDGHHNVFGEVFGRLVDLNPGDLIQVYSGDVVIRYEITNKMILPEKGENLSVRIENARWLLPSSDERLTLVTCWPQWTNTHRLIVVAKPVARTTMSSLTGKP